MMETMLYALHTGRLYPRKYSCCSFLSEAESTPEPSVTGMIMLVKNYSDTIGNQTRYLPVCSAVPKPLSNRVLCRQKPKTYLCCTHWVRVTQLVEAERKKAKGCCFDS
jgi:hypothetical protein